MKVTSLIYFLKKALGNISDNRMVHFIGLGTTVVSMLILGIFMLLFTNVNTWLEGWGKSISISIYLQEDVGEEKKKEVGSYLNSIPGAAIERFISKEEAMRELKGLLGKEEEALLEGLRSNPLPASFEVSIKDRRMEGVELEGIKKDLERLDGVEEVRYSREWVDRFDGVLRLVRFVGLFIGSLLCIGVLFIVTNTIKLTIYSRKDEIEILKLVGATDIFVKLPFVLEGVIQGVVSGLLAIGFLFIGFICLSARQIKIFGMLSLEFSFLPAEYLLALLLLSTILGLAGSLAALGRFFRM